MVFICTPDFHRQLRAWPHVRGLPDGVHILNNVWNLARPLVADRLAGTL